MPGPEFWVDGSISNFDLGVAFFRPFQIEGRQADSLKSDFLKKGIKQLLQEAKIIQYEA